MKVSVTGRIKKMSIVPEMFTKTFSLAKALLTGEDVGEERMLARLEVCKVCPVVKATPNGMSCGICGCRIKGDKSLINLARYEETDQYGCKFKGGSRWKAADC